MCFLSSYRYFFNTGCENWFETIKSQTFTSTFCSLTPDEAQIIVSHWEEKDRLLAGSSASMEHHQQKDSTYKITTNSNPNIEARLEILLNEARSQLCGLKDRLTDAISHECSLSRCGRAFVKLATRSPKDAKVILRNATKAFHRRLEDMMAIDEQEIDDNMKWIILSEEVLL